MGWWVEVVPGGWVVHHGIETVLFEFVSSLYLTCSFEELRASPAPGCMSLVTAVDAVVRNAGAFLGGVILSACSADVDRPIAVAGEVTRFDLLAS